MNNLETTNETAIKNINLIQQCKMKNDPHVKRKYKTDTKTEITYKNYLEGKVDFQRYKLEELKKLVKEMKLPITGNKTVLKERILYHYEKTKGTLKIQRVFRGFIVRNSFRLRGEAYRKRELCVNETDYVSLEPITEIPDAYFVSFQEEENGHVVHYGFNITSLIQSFKMNRVNSTITFHNPYNRRVVPPLVIETIKKLYSLCFIVYPDFKEENEPFHKKLRDTERTVRNEPIVSTLPTPPPTPYNSILNYHPLLFGLPTMLDEDSAERYFRICRMRTRPVQERINELFIEIDRLGNYTTSVWFSSLRVNEYNKFYRVLYGIWSNNRNAIPREVRMSICPFHGPFDGLPITNSIVQLPIDILRLVCLNVFENLVYSGRDEEYRRLGTFHALSALTVVSSGAQRALPYLYESLVP